MVRAAVIWCVALAGMVAAPQARAASEKIIYSFGPQPDGNTPNGTLTAVLGNLYGTTRLGGGSNVTCGAGPGAGCGTVFKVTPQGTETVLASFPGATQQNSNGGLVFVLGKLFGTSYGFLFGPNKNFGDAYSVTLDGVLTDLYSFGNDAALYPDSGLIDAGGILYGVTLGGGPCSAYDENCGAVYRMTQTGKVKVLHNFSTLKPSAGTEPSGALLSANGVLYGTTLIGGGSEPNCPLSGFGSSGCGLVFSITPAGAEKTIHVFKGKPDGVGPVGNLVALGGSLWGMTGAGGAQGCGSVFEVTPHGKERVVYSFGATATDACQPTGGLLNFNGVFYGTTYDGGRYGKGTVFSLTPGGKEKVLYSFGGYKLDGINPQGNLTPLGGILYGTTAAGGVHGGGTVFAISPGT